VRYLIDLVEQCKTQQTHKYFLDILSINMNKLLLGYFYSIALSLAGNLRPAPELIDRARGYYNHKQVQVKIRSEDGIDQTEAFAYAEWQILSRIDCNRLPVQRYDRPEKNGDFWRINVFGVATGYARKPAR
jgi:hypothetical protein